MIAGEVALSPSAHLSRRTHIHNAWMTMLRAILPAWRTTKSAAMHRESGTPTATKYAEGARHRYTVRIAGMDASHTVVFTLTPTTCGAYRRLKATIRDSRLKRTAALVRHQQPRPALVPPRYTSWAHDKDVISGQPKETVAAAFLGWQRTLTPDHTVVFSDGSERGDHATWS